MIINENICTHLASWCKPWRVLSGRCNESNAAKIQFSFEIELPRSQKGKKQSFLNIVLTFVEPTIWWCGSRNLLVSYRFMRETILATSLIDVRKVEKSRGGWVHFGKTVSATFGKFSQNAALGTIFNRTVDCFLFFFGRFHQLDFCVISPFHSFISNSS